MGSTSTGRGAAPAPGGVRPGGAKIIVFPAPARVRRGPWLERWVRWLRYGGRAAARTS